MGGALAILAALLVLAAGVGPARASATGYDIAVLLYQTHPWIGNRLPEAAARRANAPAGADRWNTVPPMVAPGAGPYTIAQMMGREGGGLGTESRPYSGFIYGGVASEDDLFGALGFDTADVNLAAAGVTARLHRFAFGLEVEAEVGIGRRFGDESLWEVWAGAGLRWRDFPWNDVIATTFGLTLVGLDYTSEVPAHERRFHGNDDSRLLGFFAPEITLALPRHPEIAILLRLHHRSNVFGLFDDGSATFTTAGLRFRL
ncbi:MAG: hypothetical protein OEO83_07115 [Alphaproteobacteria bacterium]|nr:hypothetical protein [Alphaproteobacteria bacterium]